MNVKIMIFLNEKTNSDDDQITRAKKKVQVNENDAFDDKNAYSHFLLDNLFEIRINQNLIVFQRMMHDVDVCVESRFLNRYDVIFLDLKIFETRDHHQILELVNVVLKNRQLAIDDHDLKYECNVHDV